MSTGKTQMSTCKEIRQQLKAVLDAKVPGWTDWAEATCAAGPEAIALLSEWSVRSIEWNAEFKAKHKQSVVALGTDSAEDVEQTDYDVWLEKRFHGDVPVFDKGNVGRTVNAERSDAPGAEDFSIDEDDGFGDDEEFRALNFNTDYRAPVLSVAESRRGYVYTSDDIAAVYPNGYEAGRPFLHSRQYPEYRGNPPRPARIGSYVG